MTRRYSIPVCSSWRPLTDGIEAIRVYGCIMPRDVMAGTQDMKKRKLTRVLIARLKTNIERRNKLAKKPGSLASIVHHHKWNKNGGID